MDNTVNQQSAKQLAKKARRNRLGFANRPEFYLIYLLFYFTTWFFQLPTGKDVIAIIIGVLMFLPIYFRSFEKSTRNYIPHIIAIECIGFALMPFNGATGVFHIYASCQAAFQRPLKVALGLCAGLAIFYSSVAYILGRHPIEIALVSFMGFIIYAGPLAAAEQMEQQKLKEQAMALKHKMAAIDERERIARDLHDVLGHTLTMVALKSQVAEKLLENDPKQAKEELRQIHESARHALKDVRDTVADMSITTLEVELSRAKTAFMTAKIDLTMQGSVPSLTEHQSKMMGLCLRELVTNVIRHSGATAVTIMFSQAADEVFFKIKDNGQVKKYHQYTDYHQGTGLAGVSQRIASLGGRVDINNQEGMAISIILPIHISHQKLPDREISS